MKQIDEIPEQERKLWIHDIQSAVDTYKPGTIRYMVDMYYQMQEYRIRAAAQVRENPEAALLIAHYSAVFESLEKNTATLLEYYCKHRPVGEWLLAQYGIGGVLAARLLAEFDVDGHPYAGHFWSFAGLSPDIEWKKGEKRPYNAKLKTHMWKIGSSFKMFHNRPKCHYGRLYAERKAIEVERNESGANREFALEQMGKKKYGNAELKAKLEAGFLPDMQIDLRAMRYVEKIFLSHLHTVMYWVRYSELPPLPYSMKFGGHDAYLMPPHADCIAGLEEALLAQYEGVVKRM